MYCAPSAELRSAAPSELLWSAIEALSESFCLHYGCIVRCAALRAVGRGLQVESMSCDLMLGSYSTIWEIHCCTDKV